MKILFVGVLDVSWSTNCAMQRQMEKSGHEVVAFNYRTIAERCALKRWFSGTKIDVYRDKAGSLLRRDLWLPFRSGWYFHCNGRGQMNELLVETVREGNFDLMLMSKTDSVDYRVIDRTSRYIPTWYFFMDPMDQAIRMNAAEYARRADWASATFSDVTEYFKKKGARAYWITQGVNSEVFNKREFPKAYDVVFVGTRNPKRSRYIDALKSAGISVTCFGRGWDNRPIYENELVDIYRKSRIILNFCQPGAGFSIRVFQAMGTGSFVLSEYCRDLQAIFRPAVELDWFHDEHSMVREVRQYLDDDILREQIAENGCGFVHKNHSWSTVMQRILETVLSDSRKLAGNLS